MTPRQRIRVLRAVAVALGFGLATAADAADPQPEPWRILVLNTGDFYDPASALQERAMHAALTARAPRQVEFVGETLDAARNDIADYESELLALLRRKHRGARFDLIMPIATAALSFVERHRDEFWPGVPVVFFSVADDRFLTRTFAPDITGVMLGADLQGRSTSRSDCSRTRVASSSWPVRPTTTSTGCREWRKRSAAAPGSSRRSSPVSRSPPCFAICARSLPMRS